MQAIYPDVHPSYACTVCLANVWSRHGGCRQSVTHTLRRSGLGRGAQGVHGLAGGMGRVCFFFTFPPRLFPALAISCLMLQNAGFESTQADLAGGVSVMLRLLPVCRKAAFCTPKEPS